jgi:hypothetical protein
MQLIGSNGYNDFVKNSVTDKGKGIAVEGIILQIRLRIGVRECKEISRKCNGHR